MDLKRYLALLVKHPRSTVNAAKLLTHRFEREFSKSDFVEKLNDVSTPIVGKSNERFRKIMPLTLNGKEYYLRLYGTQKLLIAARYLWASRAAQETGLLVPVIFQTAFISLSGKWYLAILEEMLEGEEVGYRQWSVDLANQLASGLRKWHAISQDKYDAYEGILRPTVAKNDLGILSSPTIKGCQLTQLQKELISRAKNLITDNQIVYEDLAVSHGDVNRHNLIVNKKGFLGWIDFDRTSVEPIWHDIANAEIQLLKTADAVTAFEHKYFGHRLDLWEKWKAIRQNWFYMHNVLQAVKWLVTDLSTQSGSNVLHENDRLTSEWSQTFFTRASILKAINDQGQDSGSIVAELYSNPEAI